MTWGIVRRTAVKALALTVGVVSLSCERSAPPDGSVRSELTRGATDPSDTPLSPIDTVRRIREHRAAGRFAALQEHLLPDQRAYVVELVQSMDRLIWANGVLQAAVTDRFGPATARVFDRSAAADAIGVLSQDVELFGERIDGDSAVVSFQVAGRLPLEEVTLVRRNGRWLMSTDAPVAGVAGVLRELADVLTASARLMDDPAVSAVDLQRELALREASIGRKLKALTAADTTP